MSTWHSRPLHEVLRTLETDPQTGLTPAQAGQRLEKYGPNQLRSKPPRPLLLRLLDQLRDPMILVLLAAAGLSLWSSGGEDWLDSAIILIIVVVNAAISISQENSAQKALEALEEKYASFQWRLGKKIPFDKEISGRFPWGGVKICLGINGGRVNAMPRGEIAALLVRFCSGWGGVHERADAAIQHTINWKEQRMESPEWQPLFPDAAEYWSSVLISANQGLLTGYPDGSFKPGKGVTRAEAAAILARLKAQLVLREKKG